MDGVVPVLEEIWTGFLAEEVGSHEKRVPAQVCLLL